MLRRSPGRMTRLGFGRPPLSATLPPATASAASERVLKKRAAQSHLSILISDFASWVSFSFMLVGNSWLRPNEVGQGAVLEHAIIRQVYLQRSNRHISLMHCNAIGAVFL